MRGVRILEQAAEEAIEAAAWHECERAGLGAEFAQAVDFAIDLTRHWNCVGFRTDIRRLRRVCYLHDFKRVNL